MLRTNPETIVGRGRPKEMKDWDKVMSGLWSLTLQAELPNYRDFVQEVRYRLVSGIW